MVHETKLFPKTLRPNLETQAQVGWEGLDFLQHAIMIVFTVFLMIQISSLEIWQQTMIMTLIVYSCFSLGWFLEDRRVAGWLEAFRNLLVLVSLWALALPAMAVYGVLLLIALSWLALTINGVKAQKTTYIKLN